jgi:hypothetical protein
VSWTSARPLQGSCRLACGRWPSSNPTDIANRCPGSDVAVPILATSAHEDKGRSDTCFFRDQYVRGARVRRCLIVRSHRQPAKKCPRRPPAACGPSGANSEDFRQAVISLGLPGCTSVSSGEAATLREGLLSEVKAESPCTAAEWVLEYLTLHSLPTGSRCRSVAPRTDCDHNNTPLGSLHSRNSMGGAPRCWFVWSSHPCSF